MREIIETEYGDVVYEDGEPVEVLTGEEGDYEDGDFEEGDVEDGDFEEVGGPMSFLRRHKRKILLGAGLGAAGIAGGVIAHKAIKASRRKKRARARRKAAAASNMSVTTSGSGPALASKLFPFISGDSVRIATSPLSGSLNMMRAVNLLGLIDRATSNTPSAPIIKSGIAAAGSVSVSISSADLPALITAVPPGTYANFFFPCFMIEIGPSILTAQPASPFTASVLQVPTEFAGLQNQLAMGNLQIIPVTIQKRSALLMVPWLLADSGPQPLMGMLAATSANALNITFTGVPDGTTMTVTLPGSTHALIKMLREFLATGTYKQRSSTLMNNPMLRLV
jgi:hypothetical protein